MNNLKGKKLDEYFRQELTRQEQPFEEYHWLVLEKRLKKNRRNRIIGWFVSSGLAAMLLLAVGISFLMNQKPENEVRANNKPGKELPAKELPGQQAEQAAGPVTGSSPESPLASSAPVPGSRPDGGEGRQLSGIATEDRLTTTLTVHAQESPAPEAAPLQMAALSPGILSQSPASTAVIALPVTGNGQAYLVAAGKDKAADDEQKSPGGDRPFKSSLSFSVFAGPDINGVNNLRNTGRGTSAGIALTYHLLPRLSISTGVAYAKKLYSTDFSNYRPNTSYTFPTDPSMVDADCRVLDIPLNLNYTVWQKKTSAIGVSAGMSSYLMLREDYEYDYEYSYGGKTGPGHYGVKNQNRHYLGVMNLGVEYQKKLGNDLSVGISPYVKLPVTDIGYGNVKLESAGITTSLNFNLSGPKTRK